MIKGFAARQPIFDKNKKVFAYEILYRENEKNIYPINIDGTVATSSVWINLFFNIDFKEISNGKKVFINIPDENFLKVISKFKPDENIVLEILETMEPTKELLNILRDMYKKGHKFALDDFVYNDLWDKLFPYIDIIKFDINDIDKKTINKDIKRFKSYGITCLLEKVETYESFLFGVECGFDYFQGYFFERPEIINFNSLSHNSKIIDKLISLLDNDAESSVFADLLEKDPAITYNFINYINYTKKGFKQKSIQDSVSLISADEMKTFLSILSTAKLSDTSPVELKRLSLQRIRFCELLSLNTEYFSKYKDFAKMIGFLSCIDGLLNRDIKSILIDWNVEDIYKEALIYKRGGIYNMIMLCHFYENGMWSEVENLLKKLNISISVIDEIYKSSIKYADNFSEDYL